MVTEEFGPWNPGLGPDLPRHLLPLSTIFRPENSFTDAQRAQEAKEFTGLELQELVVFRPERLILHELLIRITADVSVPAGSQVGDLGINFRRMTDRIYHRYLHPRLEDFIAEYARMRQELEQAIAAELDGMFPPERAPERPTGSASLMGRIRGLFGRTVEPKRPAEGAVEREERIRREWARKAQEAPTALQRAVCRALARAVSAMHVKHGRLWADRDSLAELVLGMSCNDYCSQALGQLIEPLIAEAVEAEGYYRLPRQGHPVVLNTKGASASGKSTLRPMQQKLVGRLGLNWSDFGLISPDIWRKYLLDYGSLGDAYKYAGALTGVELELIDRKLDRYMAAKAERGNMSHLLIDRFRFDSFAPDSDQAGSNLLTRFGHLIYMFFMVTPPHMTVERAWLRGLEFGRYKSVEDLLAHNVEAYSGMPEIFFMWALRTSKSVHYEFLDNSVPKGEIPRTVAFGWNGDMNILDVKAILDIDRFRKINVHAKAPEAVYPPPDAMRPEQNTLFLLQCIRRLPSVNFVNWPDGRVYARFESAKLVWVDDEVLGRALECPDTRDGLTAVAPEIARSPVCDRVAAAELTAELEALRFHTLGRWGQGAERSVILDELSEPMRD